MSNIRTLVAIVKWLSPPLSSWFILPAAMAPRGHQKQPATRERRRAGQVIHPWRNRPIGYRTAGHGLRAHRWTYNTSLNALKRLIWCCIWIYALFNYQKHPITSDLFMSGSHSHTFIKIHKRLYFLFDRPRAGGIEIHNRNDSKVICIYNSINA